MDEGRFETVASVVDKGRRAKWLRRRRNGRRGFCYFGHDGQQVTDAATLDRVAALVIPPAWRDVRICPSASGKIQALGIDAKDRVQYIYHPRFAAAQQKKKFAKIERFGDHLPKMRQTTNEHIDLEGFPLEKVCAIMTRLIDRLYIRIGSDKSEKEFRTYGITTLRKRHVTFDSDSKVTFAFVGKSYVKHRRVLADKKMVALLKELAAIGRGGKLFKFYDADNSIRAVKPSHLNHYIKSITAPEYSAKDFRTWGATVLALGELSALGIPESEEQALVNIRKTIKKVAEVLGNTAAVCRDSYIHPAVIETYKSGANIDCFCAQRRGRRIRARNTEAEEIEAALLQLFRSL